MSDGNLTEELLYEGADTTPDIMPISEIKYVGFSVINFKDLSLILECKKLEIFMIRSCGFSEVPPQIFTLSNLRKLDISANRIATLPDQDQWAKLPNLQSIDFADNNISELDEVFKMRMITNLRQIILTGNICLSMQDSFTKICKVFPNLYVLNDLVITSQYRAYIADLAIYDNSSTLPLTKTDDFFFLYVKYMHVMSQERYIRKFNAEFFCLNRVIRKYSAVECIQSVFRGYVQRKEYKRMRHAAITIQCRVKYWYNKRLKAAMRIKSCFLYFRTRQQIKFIRSVRFIQSLWRRRNARNEATLDVFENKEGKYEFYLHENMVETFNNFINENGLQPPISTTVSNYEVLRFAPFSVCHFPGSPLVYYWINATLLVRKKNDHPIKPGQTIWCTHDHTKTIHMRRATASGINWAHKCPFYSIQPIRSNPAIRKIKLGTYPKLVHCLYDDKEEFRKIIFKLLHSMPKGLALFPQKIVDSCVAQLSVQSAFRSFIERSKHFKEMRQKAIETRAYNSIRYWVKTIRLNASIHYVLSMNHFRQSIPEQTAFYMPNVLFSQLSMLKPRYHISFGYTSEKSLVLDPSVEGFLPLFIPKGRIMFGVDSPGSLITFGTTNVHAAQANFSDKMSPKWVKRANIRRISFATAQEAKHRLLLFAWITGNTNWVFTERGVLEYCAATAIQNLWIGHGTRKTLRLLGIQADMVVRMNRMKNVKTTKLYYADQHPEDVRKVKRPTLQPDEIISRLRGDYRPTHQQFQQFKAKVAEQQNSEEESKRAKSSLEPLPNLAPAPIDSFLPKTTKLLPQPTRLESAPPTTPSSKLSANETMTKTKQRTLVQSLLNPTKEELEEKKKKKILKLGEFHEQTYDDIMNEATAMPKKNYKDNYDSNSMFSTASPKTRTPLRGRTPMEHSENGSYSSQTLTPLSETPTNASVNGSDPYKRVNTAQSQISESHKRVNSAQSQVSESHKRVNTPQSQSNEAQKRNDNNISVKKVDFSVSKSTSNNQFVPTKNEPISKSNDLIELPMKIYRSKSHEFNLFEPLITLKASSRSCEAKSQIFSVIAEAEPVDKEILYPTPQMTAKRTSIYEIQSQTSKKIEGYQSAQITDNTVIENQRNVFRRVVRLRQICDEVVQQNTFDSSYIIKKQNAEKAREELAYSRMRIESQQQQKISDTMERNKIEKMELLDTLQEQREQIQVARSTKIKALKEEREKRMEQYKSSQQFGKAFISASRAAARIIEVANKQKQQAQSSLALKNQVNTLRNSALKSKEIAKVKIHDLEEEKRRKALNDKAALEIRREKRRNATKEKLEALYAEKKQSREQSKLSATKHQVYEFTYIQPSSNIQKDEIEEAVAVIQENVGSNIGFEEGHLLAEFLSAIVD